MVLFAGLVVIVALLRVMQRLLNGMDLRVERAGVLVPADARAPGVSPPGPWGSGRPSTAARSM